MKKLSVVSCFALASGLFGVASSQAVEFAVVGARAAGMGGDVGCVCDVLEPGWVGDEQDGRYSRGVQRSSYRSGRGKRYSEGY